MPAGVGYPDPVGNVAKRRKKRKASARSRPGTPDYIDPVARLASRGNKRAKRAQAKTSRRKRAGTAAGTVSGSSAQRIVNRKEQIDEDVAMLLRQLRRQ